MKSIPIRKIHSSETEPDLSGNFYIRNLKDQLAEKDMVQELHRHDSFFILFLEKAAGEHEIDFTPYKVADQSVFFMRPGQVHQLLLKKGSSGYMVKFMKGFYHPNSIESNELLRTLTNKNFCKPDRKSFNKLKDSLVYIAQEYADKQEGYQEIIKANLSIFFIELFRQRKKKQIAAINTNLYAQEQLDVFTELLEMNISTHKQASEYAEMLNVSSYQLNSITKTLLGKTASEMINEQIILEAKRYLLTTANQVNQIAYHLGYEDASYFIRFFKKHTGHSPVAFRQNFK